MPGWWLGYLAMLARPSGNGAGSTLEWYPTGRLLFWAALISAFMVAVASLLGTDQDSFQAAMRAAFERTMRTQSPELPLPPKQTA